MISKEDIKKLADLARIDIKEEEQTKLASEIDEILGYVGQVKEMAGNISNKNEDIGPLRNVWRQDENPTETGTYSKELIAEFPRSENNYLKVKKIL
jgi:aspartyl-tRNA(Asn)/glutamyl-tRNA(Gln) amidotransferase subunit C